MLVAGFGVGAAPTSASGSTFANCYPNTEIAGWAGCVVPVTGQRSIEFNRTIASIFGVPEVHIKGEDNYQGVYNGNPANLCYLYVQHQATDGSTAQDFSIHIDAEFDVQLEDPLQQAPS